MQRSRSVWSCIYLQIDVVCPPLSLSLPGRYNSFLKNIVGKCCIQIRTVRDRRQTYWQTFCFCVSKQTPFFEYVCAKRAINWNMIIKIMSEKPCQCLAQSTINLQMFRAIFSPNARSSAEKCKKWQWSENFSETRGMKKLPRKGLRTERGNISG